MLGTHVGPGHIRLPAANYYGVVVGERLLAGEAERRDAPAAAARSADVQRAFKLVGIADIDRSRAAVAPTATEVPRRRDLSGIKSSQVGGVDRYAAAPAAALIVLIAPGGADGASALKAADIHRYTAARTGVQKATATIGQQMPVELKRCGRDLYEPPAVARAG